MNTDKMNKFINKDGKEVAYTKAKKTTGENEWVVKFYMDGKLVEDWTIYQDTKEDAELTAQSDIANMSAKAVEAPVEAPVVEEAKAVEAPVEVEAVNGVEAFRAYVVNSWNEFDKAQREQYLADCEKGHHIDEKSIDYVIYKREFNRRYGAWGSFEKYVISDEKIEKDNNKRFDKWYKALIEKAEAMVGKVTETELYINHDSCLSGILTGCKGKVKIQTVRAGGYNIQRLHFRTIHSMLIK